MIMILVWTVVMGGILIIIRQVNIDQSPHDAAIVAKLSSSEINENAILNKNLLQKQLPQFRSTNGTITGLLEVTKRLSECGVYRLAEWYKFYQILITLPLGANECEKSFSALTRIKTKLRNRLENHTLETTVKYAIMKLYMNNDDTDYIVSNFYANLTTARSRNPSTTCVDTQVELYIPRKCSPSNTIIAGKDHAAIQLDIADIDQQTGLITGKSRTYAICGSIRMMGESDDSITRMALRGGLLAINFSANDNK
ncbi:unnamed protein product [Didymodactylos carnosus]|uniref:Small ribosomal subunit protein eS21 n=1 Tax=Didymodactylos carnosus TaxID=1234261 RepID=A0A815BXR4_9BILA|nr:unnamed protein product [Didymodactylos carnosus]CAF4066683.1 unnamed protein product [Didymodactylos carnosus]